ncbi:cytochrome b-c1 complex subunit 8-like [Sitophilus oryzae]|uniref:Cytochrome b-c1 complex subunit 8 n=1 Tax=Sitophilus oryzae TaxID=7048 RepID=A0A6J2Y819_SITOR|nr:cytochrome b-c1 complex subunit 8-like [Sitophilus oryzae]
MGHGFGQLYKLRRIITYRLSPYELKAFAGVVSHGFPNTLRRLLENVPYMVPPIALGYVTYEQLEKEHERLMRKNPADFENDK